MRVVLLICAFMLSLAGCIRQAPTEGARPVAGYDFEVRRAGGGHTKGQSATFSIDDNTNRVQLKDGRLTVNGKEYGPIADGGKILVDENANVTVNGQPRSPE